MTNKPISFFVTGTTFASAQIQLEQAYFRYVLVEARYNRRTAARRAGISYSSFRERLARINLEGL